MPHFICRWPCGDVLLASVESREDLDAILQERSEPGVCKVARYHGPLVLELKPLVPLVYRGSSAAFKVDPPSPAFAPAWGRRAAGGDVRVVAADGAAEPAHRVVLQCRLPALQKASWAPDVDEVRIEALADGPTLSAFLEFVYTDDVDPSRVTHALHVAALRCHVPRLAAVCERRFAQQLEEQMAAWAALPPTRQAAALDSLLEWARYADALSRTQLLDLCVHLAAQRLAAARTRPSWRLLNPKTQRLVELAAVATSPPLVHRSLEAEAPAEAAVAPGTAGAQQLAAMSIEADSYAQAGGRMTQVEWHALHTYRTAVHEAQTCPQASPLSITPAEMRACGLSAERDQRFPFEVKAPTLAPFKRLMDSVCRFAFPSVHAALGTLKQEREAARAGGGAAAAAADVLNEEDDVSGIEAAFVGTTEGIRMVASGTVPAAAGGARRRGAVAAAAAAGTAAHGSSGLARSASDGSTETAPHGQGVAGAAAAAMPRIRALQRESGWGSSDLSNSSVAPATAHGAQQQEVRRSALQQQQHPGRQQVRTSDGDELHSPLQAEAQPRQPAVPDGDEPMEAWHTAAAAAAAERAIAALEAVPGASAVPGTRAAAAAPAVAAPASPGAGCERLASEAVTAAAAASSALRARRDAAAAAAGALRPALLQLQRALVDDFVLYDDSSAARLHLVGQVVAIERGDAGAAARLLAPANADLFAYISTGTRQGGAQRACSALPGFTRAAAGVTHAAVIPAPAGSGPHQHTFTPEALAAAAQGSVTVRQANPPASELETMLQLLQAPGGQPGAAPSAPAAAPAAAPVMALSVAPSAAPVANASTQAQGQGPPRNRRRLEQQQEQQPPQQQEQREEGQAAAPQPQPLRRSPRFRQAVAGVPSPFNQAGQPAATSASLASAAPTSAAQLPVVPAQEAPQPQQLPHAEQQQQQQPQPQPRTRPAPLRLSRLLDGGGGGGVPVPLFGSAGDDPAPAAAASEAGAGPTGQPPQPAPGALPLPRLLPQMPPLTEQQLAAQVMAAPLARGAGQPRALPPGATLPAQLPAAAAGGAAPQARAAAAPGQLHTQPQQVRGAAGLPMGAAAFGSILAAINGGGSGAPPAGAPLPGPPAPGAAPAPAAGAGAAHAARPGGGAPALLAGGLLSEGGVGEWGETAEFEASLRRITCHGLMELCAALAQPPAAPHVAPGGDGAGAAAAGCEGAGAAAGGGGGVESESAAEEERTPRVGGGGCMSAGRATLTGHKRRLSGGA